LREASRRRFTQAQRAVVIGDGTPWIWNIAQELFPRVIQIVDRFHVKQTFSTVSKPSMAPIPLGHANGRADATAKPDAGKFSDLLRAVRRHSSHSEEARKCFQYLHRNRDRMPYPHFETLGLCTSSGVVEAGCQVIVGTRLKRAGMHWTLRPSNAIIALPVLLGTSLRCQESRAALFDLTIRSCARSRTVNAPAFDCAQFCAHPPHRSVTQVCQRHR
jgi:hypothetical protein